MIIVPSLVSEYSTSNGLRLRHPPAKWAATSIERRIFPLDGSKAFSWFRDQLLVFVDGALGIRQGELGALRWLDCDFDNMNFSVQHSYYWRRGGQ